MIKFTNLLFFGFLLIIANGFANTHNPFEDSISEEISTEIQRVRIDFTTPTGSIRHLLLGFTPDNAASDDFDYGYDGRSPDDFPDDLNWIINNERYIIQGVGAFDDSKKYELGMFLTNSGDIKIDLLRLENFENPIDVFIYDALLGTYTQINESSYTNNMESGNYLNRFYMVFKSENLTDDTPPTIEDNLTKMNDIPTPVDEFSLVKNQIRYLSHKKELHINAYNALISNIELFDLQGQSQPITYDFTSKGVIKLSLEYLNPNYYIIIITTSDGFRSSKKILIL